MGSCWQPIDVSSFIRLQNYVKHFYFYLACKLYYLFGRTILFVKFSFHNMLNAMQNWAASRPRLHIWVGALGALPTHMKNRADAGRAADPNGQKADEIAVRLGRPVGVALTAFITRHGETKNNQNEIPNAAASAEPPNGVAGP